MSTTYNLLKALLDPVVFVLILIAIGFLVLFKSGKKKSGRSLFLLSFFILYITSISPVSNELCYLLEKDFFSKNNNIGKLDMVIVLGGGISDNKYLKETMPSHQTAYRLLHAVQVFRNSEAVYLVCSGKGNGRLADAEVMGNAAERLGVPKQSIKLDLKSKNTKEHAEELNKMVNNKNLRIGIVTSAYHMQRSEREFRKYFFNVVPLPSDYLYTSASLSIFTFLPKSASLYKFSIALREIVGIAWYKIRK